MRRFLTGLGLGFGLGVLFAPMRGRDAREAFAPKANDMADSVHKFRENS